MNYDVIIVGAGPAGVFTALELVDSGKKVLMIEKGRSIEKRNCPKDKTGKCINCKPHCSITTGFSGAGAFSDGKLSLKWVVGGELPELIGVGKAQEFLNEADSIYLKFGADTKIEGEVETDTIREIRKKAIKANLQLINCPIRHLGTEQAHIVYSTIQKHLLSNGVDILFDTLVSDLIIENGKISGVKTISSYDMNKEEKIINTYSAPKVVVATGRNGSEWLKKMCVKHSINHTSGTVDIGVRVEVRNDIIKEVNEALYEAKLVGKPMPYENKVRTFCQNPGGFVAQENYDNDLAIVNGHSYKNLKSENTNLAILCSHNFTEPFDQPIEYGKKVAELVNMLGNGQILVQKFGDIEKGRRSTPERLALSNISPTLTDAVPGDLTAAIPYRAMKNIINFIKALDIVIPGFAGDETLLYGPEIKFYSNKIVLDKENFETSIKGLHCLGDSSGWTRGLLMASAMGTIMGRKLK